MELIGGDRADGLLTHSALIRVSGTLVVVGIGDETGNTAQDRVGIDLQVSCFLVDLLNSNV